MKRLKVTVSYPAPSEPDMDWTEPFLERGTTFQFSPSSGMTTEKPIPVEKAWVEDGILYCQGTVVVEL